jgi:hypothetical protein
MLCGCPRGIPFSSQFFVQFLGWELPCIAFGENWGKTNLEVLPRVRTSSHKNQFQWYLKTNYDLASHMGWGMKEGPQEGSKQGHFMKNSNK